MALDFQVWPKIARLNRDMIVTEKIDGINAAVIIESHGAVTVEDADQYMAGVEAASGGFAVVRSRPATLTIEGEPVLWKGMVEVFEIGAQSRNRLISPDDDNYGFAKWVRTNADALLDALGAGRHFGEWWGSGIGRGYGLTKGDKRFSLFNIHRYGEIDFAGAGLPNVATVPVLYRGPFDQAKIAWIIGDLILQGSEASLEFPNAEGVVVFHTAANQLFKVTLENDEAPKSIVR